MIKLWEPRPPSSLHSVLHPGRTPVAVVCSGAKSILDIGRTLEYLETQGAAVVTVGRSPEFPAFYSAKSALALKKLLQKSHSQFTHHLSSPTQERLQEPGCADRSRSCGTLGSTPRG